MLWCHMQLLDRLGGPRNVLADEMRVHPSLSSKTSDRHDPVSRSC